MAALPAIAAPDLFGLPEIGHVPDDVARGLATLAVGAPIGSIGANWWAEVVTSVQAFAAVHDATARRHGWSSPGLYGLSQLAPWADVSRMGAAWIVARSGHRVAGIDGDGILLISPNGARLRIYRVEPDECTVAAWALCRAPEAAGGRRGAGVGTSRGVLIRPAGKRSRHQGNAAMSFRRT